MSEVLQSGLHPDADQLSAFVERALPPGERELTLAHLAVCPRCRSVVALTLPPADEPVVPLREPARGRWFTGWNLAWSTALAVSAAVFFTIYIYRAATPRSAPARMAVAQPSPSPATPVRQPEPEAARSANPQPVRALGRTQPNNAVAATSMNSALADKPRTIEPAIVTGRDAAELIAPTAAPNQFMSSADKSAAMAKKAEAKQPAPPASFGVAGIEGPSGCGASTTTSEPACSRCGVRQFSLEPFAASLDSIHLRIEREVKKLSAVQESVMATTSFRSATEHLLARPVDLMPARASTLKYVLFRNRVWTTREFLSPEEWDALVRDYDDRKAARLQAVVVRRRCRRSHARTS